MKTSIKIFLSLLFSLAPYISTNAGDFNPIEQGYQVFNFTDGDDADERCIVVNMSTTDDSFKIALLCMNWHSGNENWVEICTTPNLTTHEKYKLTKEGKYKYKTDRDMDEINAQFTENILKVAIKSKSGNKYSIKAQEHRGDLYIKIYDYKDDIFKNEPLDW